MTRFSGTSGSAVAVWFDADLSEPLLHDSGDHALLRVGEDDAATEGLALAERLRRPRAA